MADLLLSIDHQIATVVLNRPTQRNAINYEMWCQLTELCLRLENDPQVRVMVPSTTAWPSWRQATT